MKILDYMGELEENKTQKSCGLLWENYLFCVVHETQTGEEIMIKANQESHKACIQDRPVKGNQTPSCWYFLTLQLFCPLDINT